MTMGLLLRRWLVLLAPTVCTSGAFAETYIIPIWATGLSGSDGTWAARAIGINPNPVPVTYRVTGVYPLATTPCAECTGAPFTVTIAPGAAVPIMPLQHLAGARMTAGAFAIDATGPLAIHLVAYRSGEASLRQYLAVARRWVTPGSHTISAVERGGNDWRLNLFVVNPGDTPVHVSASSGERAENETQQTVPARTTAVLPVRTPRCNGVPCPFPTDFPPSPIRVQVEADGEILTSISSVTGTWAVFSLADVARE
jgi:hypothetical protein